MARIESDTRSAEFEDLEVLKRYAELAEEIKALESEKKWLRPQVEEIVLREDEKNFRVGDFQFQRKHTKLYDSRYKEVEAEATINGQTIVCTLKDLQAEAKRLDKYLKRPEYISAEPVVITVKRLPL